MNYLIDTHTLQHCELALSLYNNWYNYSEIVSENNTLPIYKEFRDTYERYNCAKLEQKKKEVRIDKIKSYPEIITDLSESMAKLPVIMQAQAQGIRKSLEWFNGTAVTDEKTLMKRNVERNEVQLKNWLNRYERAFIKTYDEMIMPTEHEDKIWMYRHIIPNETRFFGLDIEGIAQVTAKEVRTWKFIIDNLPFYEKYVFTDKPYSDFDSKDTTNPLIFDYQLIVDLHRDFSNYLWNTIDIDNFKDYFRKIPKKLVRRENITIPEICYFFSKIEPEVTGERTFPDWMKYHIGGNSYGKNKNELAKIDSDAKELRKNGFPLTVPQLKAIENKQKIDNLFNRMLSN